MCEETLIFSASARAFLHPTQVGEMSARGLGASLSLTRLQSTREMRNSRPASLTMGACSKAVIHNFYSQLRLQQGLKPYKNKGPSSSKADPSANPRLNFNLDFFISLFKAFLG